jgi:hypothetical protein
MTGDVKRLERFLLRRGVGRLAAGRHRCTECGRTPLVGEQVHSYEREQGIVCELCRITHRGVPEASRVVRHSEFGHAVKLTARAA